MKKGSLFTPSFVEIARKWQRDAAAWREVCTEYQIDPVATLKKWPGDGVIAITERLADAIGDDEPGAADVAQVVGVFHRLIKVLAGPVD